MTITELPLFAWVTIFAILGVFAFAAWRRGKQRTVLRPTERPRNPYVGDPPPPPRPDDPMDGEVPPEEERQ